MSCTVCCRTLASSSASCGLLHERNSMRLRRREIGLRRSCAMLSDTARIRPSDPRCGRASGSGLRHRVELVAARRHRHAPVEVTLEDRLAVADSSSSRDDSLRLSTTPPPMPSNDGDRERREQRACDQRARLLRAAVTRARPTGGSRPARVRRGAARAVLRRRPAPAASGGAAVERKLLQAVAAIRRRGRASCSGGHARRLPARYSRRSVASMTSVVPPAAVRDDGRHLGLRCVRRAGPAGAAPAPPARDPPCSRGARASSTTPAPARWRPAPRTAPRRAAASAGSGCCVASPAGAAAAVTAPPAAGSRRRAPSAGAASAHRRRSSSQPAHVHVDDVGLRIEAVVPDVPSSTMVA